MFEISEADKGRVLGWLDDSRVQAKLGVLIWLAPFVVIAAMVALDPLARTVMPTYHQASADWWTQKEIYTGEGGLHYLPQFALIFSLFHALPVPVSDIAWLLCGMVLLATGIWRFQREQFGPHIARVFLYASLFAMPLCLAALRNGQANAMLGAVTLHAAACLARRQWWAAAVLIAIALGIKPLAIVMLLLSVTVYAPLRLRLVPALIALVLLPFLFAPADYVMAQYRQFAANIQLCTTISEHRFADIGGIFRTFGWELPYSVSRLVRVAAAGVFLWLWWAGARRLREPFRAMWLLTLSASYLMLFNHMNEANSYVILAPPLGLWAAAALEAAPTRRFGWLAACISLSMGLLPNLLHFAFGNYFALFWHPVMTVVFMGMLIYWVRSPESPFGP
jgi:hypothetical protein